MYPLLNLGGYIIDLYPFFVGIALGASFFYIFNFSPSLKNIFYFLLLLLPVFIGAKVLFYLSFYQLTLDNSQSLFTDFLNSLQQNGLLLFFQPSGLVFYGGMIFGQIGYLMVSLIDSSWHRKNFIFYLNALVLGHAIGRIGCFFSGCCFGIYWEAPCCGIIHDPNPRIPVPLVESFTLFLLFYYLHLRKEYFSQNKLQALATYYISYALIRLVMELFRGDSRGQWGQFPPSVSLSLLFLLMGIFLVFFLAFASCLRSRK